MKRMSIYPECLVTKLENEPNKCFMTFTIQTCKTIAIISNTHIEAEYYINRKYHFTRWEVSTNNYTGLSLIHTDKTMLCNVGLLSKCILNKGILKKLNL